jgi:hypothetical protein
MSSSLLLLASTAVKPLGWDVVVGAAAMGVLGGVTGLRVWHGKPINPRNTVQTENKFAVLTVTLLPGSAVFSCWAAIGLLSEIAVKSSGAIAALAIVVELIMGLASLVFAIIGLSLFFFSRPTCFVPPHLRSRS